MTAIDYDDPVVEEAWCAARREDVIGYLCQQRIAHGEIVEWPSWHLTPYVSIWAIESGTKPGWVGWWVICGDLPTDYLSADSIHHPRDAFRSFAQRWQEVADGMERGEAHPNIDIGSPDTWHELAPLLRSRAQVFEDWANDDDLWGNDEE